MPSPRLHNTDCPIAQALNIMGDRWTVLVLRDLIFFDKQRFNEFLESPEGISTNILSDRLRRLEDAGLIHAEAYQDRPLRHAYQLTTKGQAFRGVLESLVTWSMA